MDGRDVRVLVLGCGKMGSAIIRDMAENQEVSKVVVGDSDKSKVEGLVDALRNEKISGVRLNIVDHSNLVQLMKGFDVVTVALPHGINVLANEAAVEAGVHVVDLAYEERQWELDAPAKKAGVTLVPGCGVAPGLTNILTGYGVSLMDEVEEARLICGGVPQKPVPPLEYKIVFSAQSVVNMYCRRSRIVRDGEIVEVETLSGVERIEFPGLGEMEAFYTDGLSTLLRTMKGKVKNMCEKSVRWPGHAEKIRAFRDTGFFDTEPIDVDGVTIVPRKLAVTILDKALRLGEEKDVTVLRVDIRGRKDGNEATYSFVMVDFFDEKKGITSMARTTGYVSSIVSRMVARGDIQERGLVPPELAVSGERFERLVTELAERGIRILESSSSKRFL